ncbi:MAG: J domain-containing protein [Actinomycetota bacterium]|nr:J domain-containing protein [Actinomycetota bacterium]
MATHYQILGVAPQASHDEIRRAYHRQARRHHPDAQPHADPAASERARLRMARINAAWAVLRDTGRRRDYDIQIGVAVRPSRPSGSPPGAAGWVPIDLDDDLDDGGEEIDEASSRGPADLLVFVPVGLFLVAVSTFAFSVLTQSPTLMWGALILLPVAAVAFFTTPLLVLFSRARARAKP